MHRAIPYLQSLAEELSFREGVLKDNDSIYMPVYYIPPILDYIAHLKALTTWQPIETAPKDGIPILIFAPDIATCPWRGNNIAIASWQKSGYSPGFWQRANEKPDEYGFDSSWRPPTHWMPLPAPPALPQPEEKGQKNG